MTDDEINKIRQQRFSDKKDVSGKIGETSRFIAFGIVAIVFTIQSSTGDFSKSIISNSETVLVLSGIFACLSIVFDYLQYLFGYFSVNNALSNSEHNYAYDSKSLCYRGRAFSFWAKQFLSFSAAIIIIQVISYAMYVN